MSSQIQTLIRDGDCILWHHYKRCAFDLSGTGSHGEIVDINFTGDGIQFEFDAGDVEVTNSVALQLTTYTLVVYGDLGLGDFAGQQAIMTKYDAGGATFNWYHETVPEYRLGPSGVGGDATNAKLQTDIIGTKYHAISFTDGGTPEGWIDGASAGSYDFTCDINSNDANIHIGNRYVLTSNNEGIYRDALIFNRALTAPEHAALYSELQSMERKFDSRPFANFNGNDWHMRDGIKQSSSAVTAGNIENSGFKIFSGGYKISYETVNGRTHPVLECTADGACYIPTSYFSQSDSESAYGEWTFWANKTADSSIKLRFVSDDPDKTASWNGYLLNMGTAENIGITKYTAGGTTVLMTSDDDYISTGTWNKIKVTRSGTGEFSVYVEGVLVSTAGGSGTNPVTDNTHTTADYLVFDNDAGDKVALLAKKTT